MILILKMIIKIKIMIKILFKNQKLKTNNNNNNNNSSNKNFQRTISELKINSKMLKENQTLCKIFCMMIMKMIKGVV